MSLLINMKMPTIMSIFIFISKENFILSWVEHKKKKITDSLSNGVATDDGLYYFNDCSLSEFNYILKLLTVTIYPAVYIVLLSYFVLNEHS